MHWVTKNLMVDVFKNIRQKLWSQSSFSMHLVLHNLCRRIIILIKKIIASLLNLKTNVFHQYVSLISRMFILHFKIFWSLRETRGLKMDPQIGISILCFRRLSNKLVSAHSTPIVINEQKTVKFFLWDSSLNDCLLFYVHLFTNTGMWRAAKFRSLLALLGALYSF